MRHWPSRGQEKREGGPIPALSVAVADWGGAVPGARCAAASRRPGASRKPEDAAVCHGPAVGEDRRQRQLATRPECPPHRVVVGRVVDRGSPYRYCQIFKFCEHAALAGNPIERGRTLSLQCAFHSFCATSVFAYLIFQGRGMTERNAQQAQEAREELRRVVGFSAADEIEKLDRLKKAGSISETEFVRLRAKLSAVAATLSVRASADGLLTVWSNAASLYASPRGCCRMTGRPIPQREPLTRVIPDRRTKCPK